MQPPTPPPPRSSRSPRSGSVAAPGASAGPPSSAGGLPEAAVPKLPAVPTGVLPGLGMSSGAPTGQHESLVGRALGKYRLMSLLGEGGMGAVYRSEDPIIRRPVAVKVLARAVSADPEGQQRFLREARAAGRVIHPNIVAVFDVGQQDGRWYLVMELVTGGSAADYLRRKGPFPWPEALRVLADSCRGLGAAHNGGLIHRDIKPANIMRTADGTVKLADFGLAKLADSLDCGITQAGAVVGTPYFMSPEQCHGVPIDHRSDLYSLGATLYTLLVGQPPFTQGSAQQVMFAHCYHPVPDPRQARPELSAMPEGLLTVLARAMTKQPAERYRHADEMLADLEAVAAGQALTASGPTGLIDRSSWKSQTGSRLSKSASGAHLVAATGESSGESPTAVPPPAPSRSGRSSRRSSSSTSGEAHPSGVGVTSPTLATSQLSPGVHAETVAAITAVQRPDSRTGLLAGLIGGAVAILVAGIGLAVVLGGSNGEAGSDGGSAMVAPTKDTSAKDAPAKADTPSVLPPTLPTKTAMGTPTQPDAPYKTVTPGAPPKPVDWSSVVNVFTTDDRNSHEGSATAVRYTPNRATLATSGIDRSVRVWQFADALRCEPKFRWSLANHRHRVASVAFSPDGAMLLSCGADAQAILWDVKAGTMLQSLTDVHQGDRPPPAPGKTHRGAQIRAVAFHPNRQRFFTVGRDGYIMAWGNDGKSLGRVRYGEDDDIDTDGNFYFESLAVSRDPCYLVVGMKRIIMIFDAMTLKPLYRSEVMFVPLSAVAVTQDAKMIVAGDKDGLLLRWSVAAAAQGLKLEPLHPWLPNCHSGIVSGLAFSPDGAVLASVSFDAQLRLWDVRNGMAPLARVSAHGKALMAVDFRSDGWQIATVAQDGLLKLWQPGR